MSHDVHERSVTIAGDGGQRIGIGTGGPAARLDVGRRRGTLRFSGRNVGIGIRTPCCRLEVRSDGAVGVKAERGIK